MQIPSKGSHVTHMRLKYPGHTCVVVAGPSNQTIFNETKENDEDEEEEESDDEDDDDDDEDVDSDDDDDHNHDGARNGKEKEDVFQVYNSFDNNRGMHMMVQVKSKVSTL